ncbi:MAG TPA: CPBP family intramembrane glutamic endopeptidase [Polyangiaceae bacterium]
MTLRVRLLILALFAWASCFAVLAYLGTWMPFAFAGVLLVALTLRSSAVPLAQFYPSSRWLLIGVGAGVLMVLFTHLAYARLSAVFPAVRSATRELLWLLNVVGVSPTARAALIVVIASCEEVLFRGLLPGSARGAPHGLRWPTGREFRGLLLGAGAYALTTLPLASPLLVLCAFACGVVWGALRAATGSVLVPILAHVLWDLGVLLLWPLTNA